MRRLMLLRHAKSDWPGRISDFERPLAKRGLIAAPLMGRYMAGEGLRPDLALVSTARRTRETWGLVAPELDHGGAGQPIETRFEAGIYEAYPEHLLEFARAAPATARTLLMVGHNPGLEDIAAELASSGDEAMLRSMRAKFPTCALAVLDLDIDDWSEAGFGRARLERFVTPASIGHGPDE
jgi:phosphohistidine phosphatase